MFRLIFILSVTAYAHRSEDVFKKCIETYTNITTNDYMIGTWHKVYKFRMFGDLIPSSECSNITFRIPSAAELKAYKDKYDNTGLPFTLDQTSLHFEPDKDSHYQKTAIGIYWSQAEAKYWVLEPKSVFRIDGYSIDIYQRIDDNYMLYWQCGSRGHERWLMSRNKNAPLDEILAIIAANPVLKRMGTQRFCM